MTDIVRTGGCLCGDHRYEARGEPKWAVHCHCETCRRATGAALATFFGYSVDDITFTPSAPSTFESSPGTNRGFCARCGSSLYYGGSMMSGHISLTIGSFDDPGSVVPRLHVHYGEHIDWFDVVDDLPRYEKFAKGAEPMCIGPVKRD